MILLAVLVLALVDDDFDVAGVDDEDDGTIVNGQPAGVAMTSTPLRPLALDDRPLFLRVDLDLLVMLLLLSLMPLPLLLDLLLLTF